MTELQIGANTATRTGVEILLLFAMWALALFCGSYILWGEVLRGTLATTRDLWVSYVARKASNGLLPHYEFGPGKLEQAGKLVLSLAMLAVGFFLSKAALEGLVAGDGEMSLICLVLASLALGAAALLCAFTSVRSWLDWKRLGWPSDGLAGIAAAARLTALLVLVSLLVLAVMSRDADVALLLDRLGGALIGLFLAFAGLALLRRTLLDLTDHPMPQKSEEAIIETLLGQGMHRKEILDIRSRRAGSQHFVEITLAPPEDQTLESLGRRLQSAKRALRAKFQGLDLTVRLHSGGQPHVGPVGAPNPAMPTEVPRHG